LKGRGVEHGRSSMKGEVLIQIKANNWENQRDFRKSKRGKKIFE